jgi:hypothetical protein
MKKIILFAFFMFFLLSAFAQPAKLQINKGSRYTRTHIVTLQIAAFDAQKMKISNFSDFRDANWISYEPKVYGWALPQADGKQTVYVKFKNAAGKETETVSDDILLDRTPPKGGTIKIDVPNGAINDTAALVTLRIKCADADYMMIANNKSFFRKRWQIYQEEEKDWRLSGTLDGDKMVFIKFRDKAGNISDVTTDKVILDTQGPLRSKVTINLGEEFTTDKNSKVKLKIFSVGATHMMISNKKDLSDANWIPYKDNMEWILEPGDGERSVYAKFKDNANNISDVVSDDIVVDATPPQKCVLLINDGAEITRHPDGFVELSLTAEEADMVLISNDKTFRGARWIPFEAPNMVITDWKLPEGNGEKTVYVKFKDTAGNETEVITDNIVQIK